MISLLELLKFGAELTSIFCVILLTCSFEIERTVQSFVVSGNECIDVQIYQTITSDPLFITMALLEKNRRVWRDIGSTQTRRF